MWLAQGNLAEAGTWAAQTLFSLEAWNPLRKWEVLLVARVFLAQQQYDRAIETLERFRERLEQPADIEKAFEWMALFVVALHQAGKSAQAAPIAARLLSLTEPESHIRLYLDVGEPMRQVLSALLEVVRQEVSDASQKEENNRKAVSISVPYVSRLLAAFTQEERTRALRAEMFLADQPESQSELTLAEGQRALPAPLSRQERRVLRLLVAGQTYAEMAQALVVSPNTIKSQVSSIYRKLDARNRLEAAAAAQRLHLL